MDEPCSALDPIATLAIEDLMKELVEHYTIIIVTHNKLTMRAANCMYGITMEQEGVSKVVYGNFPDRASGQDE